MRPPSFTTLRTRLVLTSAALLAALSAALFVFLPARLDALSRRWMESRARGIAHIVAHAAEPALDFDDPVTAAHALSALDDLAAYAVLLDPRGRVLASSGAPPPDRLAAEAGRDAAYAPGLLRIRAPVDTRSGARGALEVGFGLGELEARREETRALAALAAALLLAAGVAGAWGIGTVLVAPVRRITDVATRIAGGEDGAAVDLPLGRRDEAGALAAALRTMLERLAAQGARIRDINRDLARTVEERTHDLERTHAALAELKRTQEQLVVADRRVSVGRLAAGVAHEINNPLSFVSGNLDWLRGEIQHLRRALPSVAGPARAEALDALSEMASAVTEAKEGTERVRRIVRQLKTFSRGGDDERREAVHLAEALKAALDMSQHEIRHRARVVRELGDVPLVSASPVQVVQVLVNLLVNAAQAIPIGAADRHEIKVSLSTDARGWAVAAVSDTGGGIAPEHLGRLFDPFFTTKPVGEGSGLGLSISQGIVRALGGEITVESTVGRGSTFRVCLPPCAGEPAAPPEGPSLTPPPRRARLLVVDDEPLVASSLLRQLSPFHDVSVSPSGRDALRRIAAGERYHVILCDLMMPEMTGMDLHAELSRAVPEQAARIVMVTGGAFGDRAAAFLEAWRGPCLEKPVDMDHLRRLIDERIG